MPPTGSYNPAITLESILLSIQLLLGSPNVDDPLRNDVSDEFRYNRAQFNEQATKLSGRKLTSLTNPIVDKKDRTQAEDNPDTKVDGEASVPKMMSRKRKHDDS